MNISAEGINSVSKSFDLQSFLPYKAALLASIVSEQFATRYSSEFGITVYEWRVIAHLRDDEALSVRDISQRANMDRAAVTRAVFRLESKGLVVKRTDPDDRRLVQLTLTADGRDMFESIKPLALEFGNALEEACINKGLSDVHTVLDTLIEASIVARDGPKIT